jgi:diguanylate cyclase (GGDEF)-like protein
LLDRLGQALAGTDRSGQYGALLFIDLDNFKQINDTAGHGVGDHLLQSVARRLGDAVRSGDTVARLGGDEFVVMLEDLGREPGAAADQACVVAQKMLDLLRPGHDLDTLFIVSTPSIGVTLFQGRQLSLDELVKQADIAMYQAKARGRNRWCFFDPGIQRETERRVELENELRVAVIERQWELYYQIQVDASARPVGAEILLRWRHPQRGLVSPAEFIPLAEETGLILPLGYYVLHEACQQLAAWQQEPALAGLTLAVNVSARQFRNPSFVTEVRELLLDSGAPPPLLKLEITESLLLEDVDVAIESLAELKELGVRFSLDDFGTGYSSLAYLKRLPIDQIKIDQSFVREVLTDANDATIARTILALGESFGVEVIAEGVETVAQQEFLAGHGCRLFQGYLYGRPEPLAAFRQRLGAVVAPAAE